MMFLIINFFLKKISPLNAARMILNAIMRKSLYFGLMKFYTHDLFIKT
jgi:hypothetical protein